MTDQVKNRLKSLLWRGGGQAVAFILSGLLTMFTDGTITVSPIYSVLLGLFLSEYTKYLNTK
jgi:hypothetical protein